MFSDHPLAKGKRYQELIHEEAERLFYGKAKKAGFTKEQAFFMKEYLLSSEMLKKTQNLVEGIQKL